MSRRDYTVWIYKSSASNVATTGDVDFTIGAALAEVPVVRSPTIDPLRGRSVGQPWTVRVVDTSTFIVNLADSSGRLDTLNRLCAVRLSVDGGGSSFVGVGRIQDIQEEPDRTWSLSVLDERQVERVATIFTTNTTRLYPPGPHVRYGPFTPRPKTKSIWTSRLDSKRVKAILEPIDLPMPPEALDAIIADLRPGWTPRITGASSGAFYHVKLRVGNTDYPIERFPPDGTAETDDPVDAYQFGGLRQHLEDDKPIALVFYATSSQINTVTALTTRALFLHMMSAPPSFATPLHIDTSDGAGYHPIDVAKKVLDGDYTSSGTKLPRYSTATIDTMRAETRPRVRYRITEPNQPMGQWLEDWIYGPNLMIPTIDQQGRIAIADVATPRSTDIFSFEFNASNLVAHPTWTVRSRDQVTRIRYHYTNETPSLFLAPLGGPQLRDNESVDIIRVRPRATTAISTRAGKYPEHTIDYQTGWHSYQPAPSWLDGLPVVNLPPYNPVAPNAGALAPFTFNRFADGPIMGYLEALSTASSLRPGDRAKINLGTFPNAASSARTRGGVRLIQLMQRTDYPDRIGFDYLDYGPVAQANAPTISLSTSTSDPKHSLNVTLGSVNYGVVVQVGHGAALPATGSTVWVPAPFAGGNLFVSSSGMYEVPERASGTTWWMRAAGVPFNSPGLGSSWVYSTKKATATITAPSALATGPLWKGRVPTLQWTLGDSNYPTEVLLDDSTSATLSSANRYAVVPPSASRLRLGNLEPATTYLAGVRHIDPYGGKTAIDSTAFQTPAAASGLGLLGIGILSGGSTT